MLADASLADRIYRLNKAMFPSFGDVYRQIHPEVDSPFLDVGDSYALFTGQESVITQAGGTLTSEHIKEIAEFYRGHNSPWEVIVTPFSHPEALSNLQNLGAKFNGWEGTLYRQLPYTPEAPSEIKVEEITEDQLELWNDIATQGFFGPNPPPSIQELGVIMSRTENTRRYIAYVDGTPGASASLRIEEGSAFLGGAATLPEHRNRGLQNALIARRLADSNNHADLAIIGAQPGSTSQRNAERHGFRIAYTQISLAVPAT